MNRDFLKELGLEDDAIEKIMKAHGKTVQELKPAKDELENMQSEKSNLEKQLTELQETLQSNEERLNSIDELEKQIESYKLQNLKTNIAIQAGIPIDLADRLSGATEEEIKEDAEKIARFVQQNETLPLRTTEPEKVDPKEKAYADLVDKI